MKHLILVLGAPNDEQGNLSHIAQTRLECALNLYKNNDDTYFLCTGGFGAHFNTTKYPHAYYAKKYLISKGANESDFPDFIPSANTVEDFRLSKPIIEKIHPDILLVVTSDFHMERVILLHNIILNYPNVVFIPAKSDFPQEELLPLIQHEKQAIQRLKDNNYILY